MQGMERVRLGEVVGMVRELRPGAVAVAVGKLLGLALFVALVHAYLSSYLGPS